MIEYLFLVKGVFDMHATIKQYFEECCKNGCFPNLSCKINSEKKIAFIEFSAHANVGRDAGKKPRFNIHVIQNEEKSIGLEIYELKHPGVPDHVPNPQYKRKLFLQAADVGVCLETFRSIIHAKYTKGLCRQKYASKITGYMDNTSAKVDANFEAISGAMEIMTGQIEELNEKNLKISEVLCSINKSLELNNKRLSEVEQNYVKKQRTSE